MSNKKKIDTTLFHEELMKSVQAEKLYKIRNDAKIRAVTTAKNYDEFRDIVATAHLNPVSREEMQQKGHQRWNKALH